MNWKTTRITVAFSVLFLLVYGGCNLITSYRHDVASFYFPFERHIPFVPLMFIPYMSIDLFYMAVFFVCRDDEQRRTLARRLVLEIFLAAICFLLFPMRFAFGRPAVSGLLGWGFNIFRAMDLPYNQFPSLHIAQLCVIAPVFLARAGPKVKVFLWTWFSLIAMSTVLTYQHNILDCVGGFVLAAICVHLVPSTPAAVAPAPGIQRANNRRLYRRADHPAITSASREQSL